MRRIAVPLALLSVVGFVPGIGRDNPLIQVMSLISRDDVKRALNYPDANRGPILSEWIQLTEINAPSGKERERAENIRRSLEPLHLNKIYYDAKGNLIAVRKGLGQSRAVVIDAHLDTVFKEGLKIKAQVRDGKVFAPGIGDDTRNLEAVLASIRALDEAGIKTVADLIFVFTVEEETSMDGARQFIADNKDRIGSYVALDGGYEGLTYGGIGINWYKHHFIGPGGHTRSSTPPYSATLPLSRAISRIYQMELPKQPVVNLNIGMLGGSQVVNAKADDAWFTVDLRSTDQKTIDEYEAKIAKILREEADRAGMEVRTDVLSKLPAAQIDGNRDSFTVRMAEAVHQALGFENPPLSRAGSNNSNVALLAGLPALSTGAAPCGDSHSLSEWCQIEPFYKGIKKVIMLEIALAGIADKE
ncbi:MAG TPA: M20/M25/M40 family metallo-hydrolase [Blastocatellia bacterium]|nr:M20/M25/M40 family metallo-hydrolase [Blastocatellia bacterium]